MSNMGLRIKSTRQFGHKLATLIAVFALVAQPMYGFVASQVVSAATSVNIDTVAELREAIENQDNGQIWNISPGEYGLSAFSDYEANGRTGWYFPITADNLTINGAGATIYGVGYAANGSHQTQNFVSVFGDDVTLNGMTLMPKLEPNKTIEVLGSDVTIQNVTIEPNTMTSQPGYDSTSFGGSLYFSHAGNHTVENVTIKNSGISYRYAPTGTHITLNNVTLDYSTDESWINNYRYSSGFNNDGNTVNGQPTAIYHVTNALDNFQMALDAAKAGDTVMLESDITTDTQTTVGNGGVTINGNGHTLTSNFEMVNGSNNSALGVQADDVTVKNLTVDGVDAGVNKLHGVNVYESTGVTVDNVTARNFRSGVVYNSSTGTVENGSFSDNIWHDINVDKRTSELANVIVTGTNTHSGPQADIYVDNEEGVEVTANNYTSERSGIPGRDNDRVYTKIIPNTSGPVVSNIQPSSGSTVGGAVTITATVTDPDGDDINYVNLKFIDANGSESRGYGMQQDGDTSTWKVQVNTKDFAAGKAGNYTLKFATEDDRGKNRSSKSNKYFIDNANPKISFLSHDKNDVIGGQETIRVKVTDDSELNYVTLKLVDGANGESRGYAMSLVDGTEDEYIATVDTTDIVPTGETASYNLKVSTEDSISNNRSSKLRVLVDNQSPDVSISIDSFNPTVAQIIANDPNLSRIDVSVYENNNTDRVIIKGEWVSSPNFDNDYAGVLGIANLPEGEYTIRATAVDSEGNSRNAVNKNFTVDTSAPNVAITGVAPNGDGSYTISGTSDDNDTPVTVYRGTVPLGAVTPVNGVWNLNIASLAVGDHSFTATSADAAGNSSTALAFGYTVPPVRSLNRGPQVNLDSSTSSESEEEEEESLPLTPLNPGIVAVLDNQGTATDDEDGDVLAEEDNAQANNTENGQVLADEDQADDEGCAKFLGLCWYWWIPIVGAIVAVGFIIRGMLREDDELPPARRQ